MIYQNDKGVDECVHDKKEEQLLAQKCGSEEGKTIDSILLVERSVKNLIYPKTKFLSDTELDYDQPDFATNEPKTQSVRICEKILKKVGKSGYTIHNKVLWWLAY